MKPVHSGLLLSVLVLVLAGCGGPREQLQDNFAISVVTGRYRALIDMLASALAQGLNVRQERFF